MTRYIFRKVCARCNGSGYQATKHGAIKCTLCDGKGWVTL